MKKALNIITLCAFVLLLSDVALGQKRIAKAAATKQRTSPPCKGHEYSSADNVMSCDEVAELLRGHNLMVGDRFVYEEDMLA